MSYTPLNSKFRAKSEDEVESIFQSLGMGSVQQGSKFATLGSNFNSQQKPLPSGLAHLGGNTPKILDKQNSGFFQQFLYGVSSPVMDTLSGFKLIDPRPKPEGIPGIAGNILGSIVGWTALTMLTSGIGTSAAAATGTAGAAVKIGKGISAATTLAKTGKALMSPQLATTLVKAVAGGAAANAHWAFGQQEYENIPKEALVGAVFGLGFGVVGHGVGKALSKRGGIMKTSESFIDDFIQGRDPSKMLHIKDADSMRRAIPNIVDSLDDKARASFDVDVDILLNKFLEKNPVPSSVHMADYGTSVGGWGKVNALDADGKVNLLMQALKKNPQDETLLQGVYKLTETNIFNSNTKSIYKNFSKDAVIVRDIVDQTAPITKIPTIDATSSSLKKVNQNYINKQVAKLSEAKTFGEQRAAYNKLVKWGVDKRKALMGDMKFNQLDFETQKQVSEIQSLIQDINWAMGDRVTKVLQKSGDVQLPALNMIADRATKKETLIRMQKLSERGGFNPNGSTQYHPELKRLLDQAGYKQNHGLMEGLWQNADFLSENPTLQAAFKQAMGEIDSPVLVTHPYGTFAVQNAVDVQDLNKLILSWKDLPDQFSKVGLSVADSIKLQTPATWWATKLAPVRAVIGEQQARSLRFAVKQNDLEVDKWVNKELAPLIKTLGANSKKARNIVGIQLSEVMEMRNANNAVAKKVKDLSLSVVDNLLGDSASSSDELVKMIVKNTGISKHNANRHVTDLLKIMADAPTASQIRKIAKQSGQSVNEIYSEILSGYVYNTRLHSAGFNATNASKMAKEFGTTPEILQASAQGRILFDRLFHESGIDPAMYRGAYFPHYRNMAGKGRAELEESFKDILSGAKNAEKLKENIFWANELSRTGTASYDTDFFEAYNRYVRGMSKKKHFEPVFKDFKAAQKNLGIDDTRVQVIRSLEEAIVGVPGDTEKMVDGIVRDFAGALGMNTSKYPRPTAAIGAMLAELQYSSGMGFNPFMPIRNLTQKALALSSITESGNPLEGAYWMGKYKMDKATGRGLARYLNEFNDVLDNRIYAEGLELHMKAGVKVAQKMGFSDVAAAKAGDFQEFSMKMFRWSDRSNVEDTFGAAAYYLMQAKKAPLSDAVELARGVTMATQFMYGIDSPMLYRTPLGKQLGIYQSWPLNWAQMLWEQGTSGQAHRAVSTVAFMAVMSEMLSARGWNFRTISPTETVRGILPIAMLSGEKDFPTVLRVGSSVMDYMRALASGEDAAMDTALINFQNQAIGLVPFGVVTDRTLKFIDRVRHDWRDYTDPGFMHRQALNPQTREGTSRLRTEVGPVESVMGLIGTTTKAAQRSADWEFVATMDKEYRGLRKQAISAFLDGDYDRFQKLQERLVLNFGQWIEPQDVKSELRMMGMTARERQLMSTPDPLKSMFLEQIQDRNRIY